MHILKVYSINRGKSAFIEDQILLLKKSGYRVSIFEISKSGLWGYLRHLISYRRVLNDMMPDIVHAHFGLSGCLANLQRKVPVVTTYHGSDINVLWKRFISIISVLLSSKNIFVSRNVSELYLKYFRGELLPCGVDTSNFRTLDKEKSKSFFQLDPNRLYLLFSSSFKRKEKNVKLTIEAIKVAERKLNKPIELIEFKGLNRTQVPIMMNAVDAGIINSFHEGSPQFTKELAACGTPIIYTDVGDLRYQLDGYLNSFIADPDPVSLGNAIFECLNRDKTERLPQLRGEFDNKFVINRLINIYSQVYSS